MRPSSFAVWSDHGVARWEIHTDVHNWALRLIHLNLEPSQTFQESVIFKIINWQRRDRPQSGDYLSYSGAWTPIYIN